MCIGLDIPDVKSTGKYPMQTHSSAYPELPGSLPHNNILQDYGVELESKFKVTAIQIMHGSVVLMQTWAKITTILCVSYKKHIPLLILVGKKALDIFFFFRF